jgi:hypothetical protein
MKNDKKTEAAVKFIDLSMGIEDQMSKETYGEFLDRQAWPAALPDDLFKEIKDNLMILIKETEGHLGAFANLKKRIKDGDLQL